MREPVTHDQLDDLVLSVRHTGGAAHRELAERFRAWAGDPHPLDEPGPRELLIQSGEQLELAGDLETALATYREAVSTPGPATLDPRCMIVEVLHQRGEHDEADEVENELRRSRPESAATYEYMGELCEERGETTRALGWYTRGIALAEEGGLMEAEMGQLCLHRWRLRERLGQDPDQFDEFGIDYQERVQRGLQDG